MKKLLTIVLAVAGVASVVCPMLQADVATARPRWTTVRMESEVVNITLGEKKVAVDATFVMYNDGKDQTVQMGFPLGLFESELKDFAVKAGDVAIDKIGTQASTTDQSMMGGGRSDSESGYRFQGPYKQWKTWDVPMKANEQKTVKVTYWVEPAKVDDVEKGSLLVYVYTLKTGATWKGKISQATVNVTLDGVKPDQIVRRSPSGAVVSQDGKTLTWTLRDIKPAEDIEIAYKPSDKVAAAR